MNQTQTPSAWCAELQAKLMTALDAAWALAENSDDPAVIARARDKARLCGQMAAEARKVAALVPPPKGEKGGSSPTAVVREVVQRVEAQAERDAKPPAAQAVAMREALRKLKRR